MAVPRIVITTGEPAGIGPDILLRAAQQAWDAELVVVADPGAAVIHLFDTKRKLYKQLKDAGDFDFVSPIGVALSDNRLFIVDSELKKVFILNHRLKPLTTLDNFLKYGA